MAKNLYVRVKPKSGSTEFYRGGVKHTLKWVFFPELDAATAEAFENEQMLETSVEKPADFDNQADESAEAETQPEDHKVTDIEALTAKIAELEENLALCANSLTARDEALTARDGIIAELKAALEAKTAEATELAEQVTALQAQPAADTAPATENVDDATAVKPAAKTKAK